MRYLLLCLLFALPVQAKEQHKTLKLGTLLSAVDLSGAAATRTFYVGLRHDCGINNTCDATSTTDTSTGNEIVGYNAIRLEMNYSHNNNGTLTLTCTEGETRATATGTPSTASVSSGTYTLTWSGVVVTPTLTGDKIFPVLLNLNMAPVVKCVIAHGGTPDSDDTITVTGMLIAD